MLRSAQNKGVTFEGTHCIPLEKDYTSAIAFVGTQRRLGIIIYIGLVSTSFFRFVIHSSLSKGTCWRRSAISPSLARLHNILKRGDYLVQSLKLAPSAFQLFASRKKTNPFVAGRSSSVLPRNLPVNTTISISW